MDILKKQIINEINESLIKKIDEITLSLEIYLVKNDAYEKFIKFIIVNIQKELVNFFKNQIDKINSNLINNKIDILVDKYLKSIRKRK
ncbi:hypothetical protein IKD56_02135 [bacterium]|nr:hypothetical protein [bacterium]